MPMEMVLKMSRRFEVMHRARIEGVVTVREHGVGYISEGHGLRKGIDDQIYRTVRGLLYRCGYGEDDGG